MSAHIHINDEAGLWSCSGPFDNITMATREVMRILDKRQDGPWKKVGKTDRWVKKSNPDHYIEIVVK